MAKRSSVSEVLSTLSAGDKDAMAAKEAALASIPMPHFEASIPFVHCIFDRDFNVRDSGSYSFENNKPLYNSLRDFGLQMRGGDNLSFSLQSDGVTYKALSGHLRGAMMLLIRSDEVKARASNGIVTTDENPLPFQTIFGMVFSGLTRDQEIALMADHTMKKGLNEFELCKEVAEFVNATGLTDIKAATYFGMEKNKIARIRMRYAMPTVFEEYRKQKSGDPNVSYIEVGNEVLAELYKAYRQDIIAGNDYRQEGPNFRAAYKVACENPTALKRAGRDKPLTSQDRDTLLSQAKSIVAVRGNNPEIEAVTDILAWAANESRDGKVVSMNDALDRLTAYCEKLRTERDELTVIAREAQVNYKASREECIALRADVNALRSDNDALRAERDELKNEVAKRASKASK